MNDREVDALDRALDALGQGGPAGIAAAGREDVLAQLAAVPAERWPDRAAGDRITEAVAAKLGAGTVAAAVASAHSNGYAGLRVLATGTAGLPSGGGAAAAGGGAGQGRIRPRRQHPAGRRRKVMLVAAAAVLAGGAITALVNRGGAAYQVGPPQVYHSRFSAAVLPGLSQPAGKRRSLAGGWRLVSYLSEPGWHATDIGTPPISVSCPTTSVCYLVAARPVPVSGPGYLTDPRFNLLEVSRDGGASWTTLSLPADISISTPLQCPVSATTCYAAGYDASRAVLLTTTDGGQSWSARRLPGSVSYPATLACTTDGHCVGLFGMTGWVPGTDMGAQNAAVLVTRDGGLTWSAGPPAPHGQLPDYLACGGATCVLFDQPITRDNSQSVNGNGSQTIALGSWAAWYSHDGGATWQRGQHPDAIWTMASHDLPASGTISCSDRLHCWAAMSSLIGEPGIATAFVATSDGGVTWVTQSLPVQRAQQFIPQAMSCPTALECYAAGGDMTGPVILTTRDGGTIWSPVSLPKTAADRHDGGGEPAIGLIACAAARRCVAAPEDVQSAHRVPIYSLGSG